MSRISQRYSHVRPKTTTSYAGSSWCRENYQSLETCSPCKKQSLKYKPIYVPSVAAEQYLKSSVKCNLSKFLLNKIRHFSVKKEPKINNFTLYNPQTTDIHKNNFRKSTKRVIAEPYLMNNKQKLQRLICKMDENDKKYKQLCSNINVRIQRSFQKRRDSPIAKSNVKIHRKYKSSTYD